MDFSPLAEVPEGEVMDLEDMPDPNSSSESDVDSDLDGDIAVAAA